MANSVTTLLPALLACTACAGAQQSAESARQAAACTAVEKVYGEHVDALMESKVCAGHEDRPQDCGAYLAVEDIYIATLKELGCLSSE